MTTTDKPKTLQSALADIYRLFGEDSLREGRKLAALTADILPGQRKELNLLSAFTRCGGNTALLDLRKKPTPDYAAERQRLCLRMESDYGISVENSAQVCDAFWQAIGGRPAPVRPLSGPAQTAPPAQPGPHNARSDTAASAEEGQDCR